MNTYSWWFWLIPIVVLTLLTAVGVMIYSRPKRDDEPTDSVAQYERFRSAMNSQLTTRRAPRPPADSHPE